MHKITNNEMTDFNYDTFNRNFIFNDKKRRCSPSSDISL